MATAEMRNQGEFMSFQPECLAAIYLGCRVTESQARSVLDFVMRKRYATDIYIGVKDEAEFALSFVPLSNGRARSSSVPIMDIDERGELFRQCLDAYFDFWNEPGDHAHGGRKRLMIKAC